MTDKALIFSNLIKGVPLQQVAREFKLSEEEILRVFSFVLRKIKSYVFLRQQPMVIAHDIATAQKYRLICLRVLPNLNLEKEPQFKDIQNELVNDDNVMSVARNLNT